MNLRTATAALVVGLSLGVVGGAVRTAHAGADIDVDLFFRTGSPSHNASFFVSFDDDPEFVRIPGCNVRYVRGANCDMYYCDGWYYAYDDGYWYRGRNWDGPWGFVQVRNVPRSVVYVPERYRRHWVVVGDRDPWHRHEYARRYARHEVRDRYSDRCDVRSDRDCDRRGHRHRDRDRDRD